MSDPKDKKTKISAAKLSRILSKLGPQVADNMDIPEELEDIVTMALVKESVALAQLSDRQKNPLPVYTIGVPGLMEKWPKKGEPGYDQMVANAMIMERTLH